MTQAESFPHPTAVIQQGKEEAVPQPGAPVEDRLRLGGSQDPRQLLRRLQRDRPAAIRLAPAGVVQERLPAAAPAGLPRGQQVTDLSAVAGLVRIERAHRGKLAVHRRRCHLGCRVRQHRDLARPARRRQLQPGHELADILKAYLAPVNTTEADELPVVLEIVSVGLHGVRRPADVGEIGQEPVDRDDWHVVLAKDRPRTGPRAGDRHRMNEHRLLLERRHEQGRR
jgi:hypothetical protein